jgi:hypothetical protein
MKKILLCLAPALFLGCLPSPDVSGPRAAAPERSGSGISAALLAAPDPGPFSPDSGTVFLADLNRDTRDRISGNDGALQAGEFRPALYGSGTHPTDAYDGKYIVDFANNAAYSSLDGRGSLEALVRYDGAPGFNHIVEKAWQYAISAYDGKLAVSFGTEWWYSEVSLPVGRWSYVAATFDRTTATLDLYLNGARVASAPYEGLHNDRYSTGYDLAIGNSSSGEYDMPFQGTVDAARVHDRVLRADEIAAVWAGIERELQAGPFRLDAGTAFLCDFDKNALDQATGATGTLRSGEYRPGLFGFGIHPATNAYGKYVATFPNVPGYSLASGIQGSLEALVWYDGMQSGFAHIIDKAWQYAFSAYNGKLAADFGTTWWYSNVSLPVGRWSYVAATFDGATLNLYLNGTRVASTPYAGYRSSQYSTAYDLGIGNSASPAYNIPFRGTFDAARISRVVRTDEEIAAAWQAIAGKL